MKTVRYYANVRLVKPHSEPETGYRIFSEEDVAKLQFVGKARKFNFSIDECRDLLQLYENKNRSSKEVKYLTLEKIKQIDRKLIELQSLRDQLNRLVNQCKGNSRSDCPILDALADRSQQNC